MIGDISARNIWKDDKISIFDIQLTYPFCKSNNNTDPTKIIEIREGVKKRKYMKHCREHNLNFTPCVSALNLVILDDEFKRIIKNIAERLEQK